jgi:hypothetical protein
MHLQGRLLLDHRSSPIFSGTDRSHRRFSYRFLLPHRLTVSQRLQQLARGLLQDLHNDSIINKPRLSYLMNVNPAIHKPHYQLLFALPSCLNEIWPNEPVFHLPLTADTNLFSMHHYKNFQKLQRTSVSNRHLLQWNSHLFLNMKKAITVNFGKALCCPQMNIFLTPHRYY